ncbi:MAG: cupin domain-containing protein [Clostridiaceae bacterium]
MAILEKKNFHQPEKTQTIGRMKIETVTVGTLNFMRVTAEPGWKWSEDLKPVVQTESCQVHHIIQVVSGKIHTIMDDGTGMDFIAGDICSIPPGHNGWTVGDQPAVWIELPH